MTRLTFCGAAGTVTGSCTYVATSHGDFLVDCGLFQGNKTTRQLNDEPFPFTASEPSFVVLTHAHIDHSGLLPKLVKSGFQGKIFATQATIDLLEFMLLDSAYIQESNAEHTNRHRRREGKPERPPIYTVADAKRALEFMSAVDYESWFSPAPGIDACMWNAGHLLGSASVELKFADPDTDNTMRLLFSGDLGPDEKAFHPQPDAPEGFDYIICESTYGDRERDDYTLEERRKALKHELVEALARGGNVIIPSFAVERSQELLHDIGVLLADNLLPGADVYLDSPLARKATQVFIKHAASLSDVEVDEEQLFRHERFHIVESVEESKRVNRIKSGAIVISASGMCNAGRIKHHLRNNIWRPESTILFVGYQSPGTLGHIIQSGVPQVRIHGRHYQVMAAIRSIGNYSAHADQGELCDWIAERQPIVGGLFLNHGDDEARQALSEMLAERGVDKDKIVLPRFDEQFDLTAGTPQSKGRIAKRLDESEMIRDWHNDYAAFILELANRLEETDDTVARSKIIARLKDTLRS